MHPRFATNVYSRLHLTQNVHVDIIPTVTRTPLSEKVPEDYQHIHVLFIDSERSAFVLVDGTQELCSGITEYGNRHLSNVLDWLEDTICHIRFELEGLQ